MPAASQDEQFKFLISCIRYSNNGKVDFAEVAKECQIVSKGAAAKRYERMMKFHGLHQPASSLRETLKPAASADESKPADPTSPGKKASENRPKSYTSPNKRARKSFKGYDGENCNLAVDDDEELVHTSAEKIKTETTSPSVKEEPQAEYQGMTGFQYPMAQEGAGTTAVGSADMPGDYLQPGDFEAHLGSYNHTFDGLEDVFPDIEGGLSGT